MIDATHDFRRRSWIASANGHSDFPIQNLPFGVFSPPGERPRGGVAIGDEILDLAAASEAGLFAGLARDGAEVAAGEALNPLLALGTRVRTALRERLADLLDENGADAARAKDQRDRLFHRASDCTMHLPAQIGDFTDFFAGIHHATNAGRLARPDNPLLPNYKYVPIAYHGRASSIRPSGYELRRPRGQRKPAADSSPTFGPSRNLDFELELGLWVGPGNGLGEPISIAQSGDHIAGFCLLNDWSARDIQGWEYQPLGPFLAKNFATTISPWVVTPEALAPFRIAQPARPEGDPAPLDYLLDKRDQQCGALDIVLEVALLTAAMREKGLNAHRLSLSNTRYLYWTPAQLVAHHTCGGCNLRPGDILASGTISGPTDDAFGSLLEITSGGRRPLALPSAETRRFLEDGDDIIMRAWGVRDGFARVGFGECRGRIGASLTP